MDDWEVIHLAKNYFIEHLEVTDKLDPTILLRNNQCRREKLGWPSFTQHAEFHQATQLLLKHLTVSMRNRMWSAMTWCSILVKVSVHLSTWEAI